MIEKDFAIKGSEKKPNKTPQEIIEEAKKANNLRFLNDKEKTVLEEIYSYHSLVDIGKKIGQPRQRVFTLKKEGLRKLELLNSLGDITELNLPIRVLLSFAYSKFGFNNIGKLRDIVENDPSAIRGIWKTQALRIKKSLEEYDHRVKEK